MEQSRSTLNRDVFVVFSSLITDAAILLMIDFLTVLFSSGACTVYNLKNHNRRLSEHNWPSAFILGSMNFIL